MKKFAIAIVILVGLSALAFQQANFPGGSGAASLPTGLSFAVPELDVSAAASGNGVLGLAGNTSGIATFTAPAVAGTRTNAVTASNVWLGPDGSATNPTYGFTNNTNFGMYSLGSGSGVGFTFNGTPALVVGSLQDTVASTWSLGFGSGNATTSQDTNMSRSAAGVLAVGASGTVGVETGLIRWNTCKVSADITLPVNTTTTVCSWSLPAVAKTWGWQCQIPWVISAGTGTNTLAVFANASQTPTGTTNVSAEIKTTNTNTATESVTAFSASGDTTLLTSPTITPAATVFQSSTSGTLLASGTAGTFAIRMQAAGTTATAAAKAGATCMLY